MMNVFAAAWWQNSSDACRVHDFDKYIAQVKPLVDVVKCPDWVRPAVQQVFGKARTRDMMGDV